MELFLVDSGPRIASHQPIQVPEEYEWFSATCGTGTDTLVAMCYLNGLVRVHRLRDDQLEKLADFQLTQPWTLMWLADRLLVADWDREKRSHAVIELEVSAVLIPNVVLEVSDTRLEHRRELIANSENIRVHRLCAVNDGFAIFDSKSKDILYYSFTRLWMLYHFRKFLRQRFFHRAQMQNNSFEEVPLNPLTGVMQESPAIHAVTTSICQVKYKSQSTNGAIYGYEYPEGTHRTLFITSFLDISNVNEITDVRLLFEDKTIGNQNLTPDWVKWLWKSPVDKFNVTVIEFSQTALNVLSRTKYERLTSDVPVVSQYVNFQYCKESLNYAKGRINKVIEDVIEYSLYSLDTEEICCGFPLLSEQLKVVGIHVNSNILEERVVLKAINIGSILDAFKTFITEQLGGRTENERWLEKIAQIPKNEFYLIGRGGFGTVYKIKASNSTETFVAVKVVIRLGNLDDYKSQVDALQKEYKVVTTLGNHPRIIQFFAIVPDQRNCQIMIVMEYMEGGSLADKLQNQQPLPDNSVLKYLTQILEGVSFLHIREIYNSDIKPANILFNAEDNLKISDFKTAEGIESQTKSSATSSNFQGDFHYMSPERLKGAANDIWSVGATFVHMISGQPLNHLETDTQLINNISQYKICINGNPYSEYMQTLNDSDFKKKVISKTLCKNSKRTNCAELLSIVVRAYPPLKLVRRIPKQTLIRAGKKNPDIKGMSYNSARDELFLADRGNNVMRAMRVCDNAGDLRDVYRAPHDASPSIMSVCHISVSDTLLVCSGEYLPNRIGQNWLVALSRNGSEWRETQRVKIDKMGWISCALSDSRVLIGQYGSTYMEMFRVESGPRIARVHRIHVPEEYFSFSATCGSDTLVAMCYSKTDYIPNGDNSVRVHRLPGDRLEELARIQLKRPHELLWLADRLLVADLDSEKQSDAVIELEVSDTRLERRRELIATSENIRVHRLCAVNDGVAICDHDDILHYSFV